MTEKLAQLALLNHFNNDIYKLLNVQFFNSKEQADFIVIRRSGYVIEVEIKLSKADFKKPKHEILSKKSLTLEDKTSVANRFYFLVPEELITVDETPSYAGLMYLRQDMTISLAKTAPLVHKHKTSKHATFNKLYYFYGKRNRAEIVKEIKK